MLWQKSWWESRIMLWVCLAMIGFLTVMEMTHISPGQSWSEKLLREAGSWNEETRQALPSLNSFQGQVWAKWFKVTFKFLLPYLAMCWATFVPGCASPHTGKSLDAGRIFMLSLPVSRRGILLTQAATGCVSLWLIAVTSSLTLPIISRWKGQWYSVKDALIFASLSVLGAMVFYSLTLLMTVVFDSGMKALLLGVAVFATTLYPLRLFESSPRWNINRLIAGEDYFLHGQIPWLVSGGCLLISALLVMGAVRVFERRDF